MARQKRRKPGAALPPRAERSLENRGKAEARAAARAQEGLASPGVIEVVADTGSVPASRSPDAPMVEPLPYPGAASDYPQRDYEGAINPDYVVKSDEPKPQPR